MKNNKIIAEFMGMTFDDMNDKSVMIHITSEGNEVIHIDSMKYHISWDWLMPVVDKIEGLGTNIEVISGSEKLQTTYKAVMEFINNLN
tara:strand:+ start:1618 stop:1881 length:264 start_codon:yes stop_codon:yes gene_type:complete